MILRTDLGFTLIELVMIIVILGILGGVATMKFSQNLETAKFESTRAEMEAVAIAIVGNPNLYAKGARSDFGYVGDIGALPPNLDALSANPGGYSTWDGPYIKGDFNTNDFKKDGWGTDYTYTDTLLRSVGSGSNIDKVFAANSASLRFNSVCGYVVDASMDMPGSTYDDSLMLRLTYPDGSGGLTNASINPDEKGSFCFNTIPIGNHTLTIIYAPDSDTVTFPVCVVPNHNVDLEIIFPADLW